MGIPNPWGYNYDDPPTKASTDSIYMVSSPKRTVIVIGRFDNPKLSPIEWKDIGSGMSDALTRTLLNDHRFDVRINDSLAKRIATNMRSTEGSMSSFNNEAKPTYKDIDFVITVLELESLIVGNTKSPSLLVIRGYIGYCIRLIW